MKKLLLVLALLGAGSFVETPVAVAQLRQRTTNFKADTVAEMLTSPRFARSEDGDVCVTARYSTSHTVGDGSGGEYVYDADSTATIDGGFVLPGIGGSLSFSGTTFNGTAGTGRWLLKDTTVANVMQFGAVGDGVTDDYAAIQNAVSASSIVEFAARSFFYNVVSTLAISKHEQRIRGNGATILVPELWGNIPCVEVTGDDVVIDGLLVYEDAASATNATKAAQSANIGIKISGTDARIHNCTVVGFGFPFRAEGASADGVQVSDCDFSYGASWVEFDSVKRVMISGSHAHHNGLDGWKLQNEGTRTIDGFRMTNCTGYANGQRDTLAGGSESTNGNGIDIFNGGKLCVLTNCRFYENYGAGFNCKGNPIDSQPTGEVVLIGCTAEGNLSTTGPVGNAGFEINTNGATASSFVRLIGCSATTNTGRGVYLLGGYGHSLDNCQVRGNLGGGITISENCYDLSINNTNVFGNTDANAAIVCGTSDTGLHVPKRWVFRDCVISGNYDFNTSEGFDPKTATSTKLSARAVRVYSSCADIQFENCRMYNTSSSDGVLFLRGRDVHVNKCYIYGANTVAIACYTAAGATTHISHCHIEETDYTSTSGAGIWVFSGHEVHASGNRFTQSASVVNAYALKYRSGALGLIDMSQPAANIALLSNSSTAAFLTGNQRKQISDNLGNLGATATIDFDGGVGDGKYGALTTNTAITFSGTRPGEYWLKLTQDATGGRNPTFPNIVNSPPTINATANAETLLRVLRDESGQFWCTAF